MLHPASPMERQAKENSCVTRPADKFCIDYSPWRLMLLLQCLLGAWGGVPCFAFHQVPEELPGDL